MAGAAAAGAVWQAFAVAGAASGLCEGLLTAAASEVRLQLAPRNQPAKPRRRLAKPLVNVVVVGDKGAGKTSLAYAFAGRRDAAPGPTQKADFLFVDTAVDGAPASFSLWHCGGREEAAHLGPAFYSLADAFLVAYSPAGTAAQQEQHPTATLDYWADVCCGQGLIPASLPLVAVANWRPGGDAAAQAAAVAAAEQWCRQHGGVPHFVVRGPEDAGGIQAAFSELLRVAVRRHEQQHRGQQPAGGAAAAPGGMPAALAHSEPAPALLTLTPTKQRRMQQLCDMASS